MRFGAQRIRRYYKDTTRRWIRHVDNPEISATLGLAHGNTRAFCSWSVLNRSSQNVLDLRFGHIVAIDVRLTALRVDVVADLHAEILSGMKLREQVPLYLLASGRGCRAHRVPGDRAVWAGRLGYGPRVRDSKWPPLRLTRLSLELGRIVVVIAQRSLKWS